MATRTDYDRWACAKCGREIVQRSLPHNPPQCCGTGMWWEGFTEGAPYIYEPPAVPHE